MWIRMWYAKDDRAKGRPPEGHMMALIQHAPFPHGNCKFLHLHDFISWIPATHSIAASQLLENTHLTPKVADGIRVRSID